MKLNANTTTNHRKERMKPASKKGSGTMMGPTPSSRLTEVKMALLVGMLSSGAEAKMFKKYS